MSKEEVEVTIDVDGAVEIAVRGVKGKSCTDITKSIENALGSVKSVEKTREYNERPAVTNKAVQKG